MGLPFGGKSGNHSGQGFKPGKSANPGGRPRIAKALAELGETSGKVSAELFKLALEVVRKTPKGGNDANWRYAHQWLADRILGKPPVTLNFGDGDEGAGEEVDFTELTDDELDDIIAKGSEKPADGPVES